MRFSPYYLHIIFSQLSMQIDGKFICKRMRHHELRDATWVDVYRDQLKFIEN